MFKGIRDFLELIRVEHTLFALPFAYLGMFLAARVSNETGWPTWHQTIWITVAMVAARTLAMAANRLTDRRLDAANPRTAQRPLVSGRVPGRTAWIGSGVALIVLVFAARQLGPMPLKLLPGALLFLLGYAFAKRITWLTHYILGFTDGLAPMGAWVAVSGTLLTPKDRPAWLLLAAVTAWIGGFDILYACQDLAFDREHHLHAIPARFGIQSALRISLVSHLIALGLLILLGLVADLSWPYYIGLIIVTGLLVAEHRLINEDDLSQLHIAFFHVNSAISLTLFAGVLIALATQST
jgi:4-hydroxybenzoate polyprenyltransferase